MATKRFSDSWLRGLKPAPDGKREEWLDEAERGLAVTVNAGRRLTFTLIARYPGPDGKAGHPVRRVLGDYRPDDPKDRLFVVKAGVPVLSLDAARQKAREWKAAIAAGVDPGAPKVAAAAPAPPDTVGAVFAEYRRRHVLKEGQKDARGKAVPPLRSAGEIERVFNRYVLDDPDGAERWRNRPIAEIRRRDVVKLLDDVHDRNGAVQADRVLAQISAMFSWYALRGDDFASPVARGMRRSKPAERRRERVLSDAEIRAFWQACEGQGTFGAFCRVALLTGQRRAKVAQMRWQDLSDDGLWAIATEAREKGNAEKLQLPALALKVIDELPRAGPFVFAGRLGGPINGWRNAKAELDAAMAEAAGGTPIEPWVIHDLRRTSKTLMMKAGVGRDVSERVLGHAVGGVEAVYDRHEYFDEKADALRRLADLIARIVDDAPANVVPIGPKRHAKSAE